MLDLLEGTSPPPQGGVLGHTPFGGSETDSKKLVLLHLLAFNMADLD